MLFVLAKVDVGAKNREKENGERKIVDTINKRKRVGRIGMEK